MLNCSNDVNFFDLTHTISPKIMVFPKWWHKSVEFEQLGNISEIGRNTSQMYLGTHVGTHIDAPMHFIAGGSSVDELEISKFVGETVVLDLREIGPNKELNIEDLDFHINVKDKILILNFGWSQYFGTEQYYSSQPYLSLDLAKYIVSCEPKLIGYDMAMPDNPKEGYGHKFDSRIHKEFLSNGIPLLENLKIDTPLPSNIWLACLPLKLGGLDGSPVRCVGWC